MLLSAVNVVSSNPCVGPSPRIKIYFFLLCTEEHISTPKVITLQPNPALGIEKVPRLSNSILYVEYF